MFHFTKGRGVPVCICGPSDLKYRILLSGEVLMRGLYLGKKKGCENSAMLGLAPSLQVILLFMAEYVNIGNIIQDTV